MNACPTCLRNANPRRVKVPACFYNLFLRVSVVFLTHVCGPHRDLWPDTRKGRARGVTARPERFSHLIRVSNTDDALLFFREKLKMKEREEAWVKIENLAKANPQVLHPQRGTAVSRLFVT